MNNLKTLFSSKKFLAMIIGVTTIIASQGVTPTSMNQAAALVISYIFAQGIADQGKSAEILRQNR